MAKRANLPGTGRRGAGISGQTLIEASTSLTDAFEQEHSWRLDILKNNELLSRKAVETEMETKALAEQSRALTKRLKDLTESCDQADGSVTNLAKQVAALEKQRDGALTRQSALDAEARGLEREIKDLARQEEALKSKTEGLKADSGRLGKDVARLEELRTQYLNEIAKFKEAKRRLTNM